MHPLHHTDFVRKGLTGVVALVLTSVLVLTLALGTSSASGRTKAGTGATSPATTTSLEGGVLKGDNVNINHVAPRNERVAAVLPSGPVALSIVDTLPGETESASGYLDFAKGTNACTMDLSASETLYQHTLAHGTRGARVGSATFTLVKDAGEPTFSKVDSASGTLANYSSKKSRHYQAFANPVYVQSSAFNYFLWGLDGALSTGLGDGPCTIYDVSRYTSFVGAGDSLHANDTPLEALRLLDNATTYAPVVQALPFSATQKSTIFSKLLALKIPTLAVDLKQFTWTLAKHGNVVTYSLTHKKSFSFVATFTPTAVRSVPVVSGESWIATETAAFRSFGNYASFMKHFFG